MLSIDYKSCVEKLRKFESIPILTIRYKDNEASALLNSLIF